MGLRIILLIVCTFLFTCSSSALDDIEFADSNLEQAIQKELGISTPVTKQRMLGLRMLHAEESSIKSLEGLRYATNLKKLYRILPVPLAGLPALR